MWQITFPSNQFVSRHRGTLPVLICCPHGGTQSPPGLPVRTSSTTPSGCDFSVSADLFTREVAAGVAQRLLELTGEAPSVVMADFHRKFLDANRSAACAFQDPNAQPLYDEYHGAVRSAVDDIRTENGGLGLLFDLHGTAGLPNDPADVYLGTDDGATIARLLRVDAQAMTRRRSLRTFLEAAGYVVSPQPGASEAPSLNGGFTVRTYGSGSVNGLDAMQLEIQTEHRTDLAKRAVLIDTLAYAMASMMRQMADVQTIGASRSLGLLDGAAAEATIGALQRRGTSSDAYLRLGGAANMRGRVDIRHDPDGSRRAGVLVLYDEHGGSHFVWVDTSGNVRISRSDPGSNDQAGVVVGP